MKRKDRGSRLDSLGNEYVRVQDLTWSEYEAYQLKGSNIYYFGGSWKATLNPREEKGHFHLRYFRPNGSLFLSQTFTQNNGRQITMGNEDAYWSHLRNTTDSFFNDSSELVRIEKYNKGGSLFYLRTFNPTNGHRGNYDYLNMQDDTLYFYRDFYRYVHESFNSYTEKYRIENRIIRDTDKYYFEMLSSENGLLRRDLISKKSVIKSYYRNGVLEESDTLKGGTVYANLQRYFRHQNINVNLLIEDLYDG